MRSTARRVAAVLAAPALTLSVLAATSSPASAAVDPGPATAAGTWLVGQLDNGLLLSPYDDSEGNPYPDFGASIDAALSLHAVGAPAPVVGGISDAVAARVDEYVTGDAAGDPDSTYAGATAKAAVLAQTAGDDPTSFGGVDLIQALEGVVDTEGATNGRIVDVSTYGDYANTLGQAFAAQALDTAGSDLADPVTDFLLDQQCAAGFFRQSFAAIGAADQTCDGGAGQPDVDATSLAVQSLQSQLDDTDVAGHVADAVAWLKSAQNANGSFGADASLPNANANSTGLAGYALLLSGETEAAQRAAAWLRAHQATNVAHCFYYDPADTGSLAYDNASLKAAQAGPMDDQLRYTAQRSTAQALPALLAAQAGPGDPQALFAAEYVKAGGKKPVGVVQAAPGEALCAMLGEQSVLGYANAAGEGHLPVVIPTKTGTSKVKVANADGTFGTAEIHALGAKKLPFTLKNTVAAGRKQLVKVSGLAPGESLSIVVHWPKSGPKQTSVVTAVQANSEGRFTHSFKVPHQPGKGRVVVTGQFGNRKNSKSFTVTR
jgi:hypothetical protein